MFDGRPVAKSILDQIKSKVEKCTIVKPRLAVVLTRDDPASLVYINKKIKSCAYTGIESKFYDLRNKKEHVLHDLIEELNEDSSTHGILVQLPLADGFDKYKLFDLINPNKDVDCFSPVNVGKLNQNRCMMPSCTPQAIIEMGNYYNLPWKGNRVTIINNSDIVGKPLSMMLTHIGATTSMCHINTKPQDLRQLCINSDIIVVAVGIPNFITADMVTTDHVVYDIGTNRVNGVLCGDVAKEVQEKARCTKNPFGVGPITVSCLVKNTYQAFAFSNNSDLTI